MHDPDPLVREFLAESRDNLDQVDRDLVALEQDPADRGRLGGVFRTVHTIKGTCTFFGFAKLERLAHVGENLLDGLRSGHLALTRPVADALLALVDAVRGALGRIEATGGEGDADHRGLMATLTRLAEGEPGGDPSPRPPPPRAEGVSVPPSARGGGGRGEGPSGQPPHEQAEGDGGKGRADAPPPEEPAYAPAADGHVRVDVGLLDRLMTLVGELVLARNQLVQYAPALKDPGFAGPAGRLSRITGELQEGVMKTRMQPIGTLWDRLPRVVRDVAAQCGKRVRLEADGRETELDRTVIEAIKDPLTHIVRNAIDHGIEPPAERAARGKPADGVLRLRAHHEGGQVVIEIADDGGGIRPDKVRAKAVARGLVDPDRAARMTDAELSRLVFLPGFSTAEAVTSVSGRGVGMDVVKTNVERIGGAVDLRTAPGEGTTVRVTIPLTLAIIPAVVATCGGERYAVPQAAVRELVRLGGGAGRGRVESFHGAPVYRLRGDLLPLADLRRLLDCPPTDIDGPSTVIVLHADGRPFGLLVDGVQDTEEIVVKPLAERLGPRPEFAGATVMGDGRVALILDVAGVARRAGLPAARDRGPAADAAKPDGRAERQPLLLVGIGGNRRLAVPVGWVARLEEVPAAAVEWSDGEEVIRYRGDILPLVRVADLLGGGRGADADADVLRVVVVADGGRTAGLVVDAILDTVEAAVEVRRGSRRPGLVGAAVVQDRVTDLIDVPALLALADPVGV